MTKTFTDFLTEAKFSENAVEKVLFNIKKLIEKKTGQKLYRYGGETGFQEIQIKSHPGTGKGFLYFTTQKTAIRFNFVKGEFISINIWKQWKIGEASDFYIDFGGANIVKIASLILDKIYDALHGKNIKGMIPVYLPESYEPNFLTEAVAGKITPEEFFKICRDSFPEKSVEDFKEMHWSEIANAGASHNLKTIPQFVKQNPVPGKKGYYSVIPAATPAATVAEPSNAGDPILYIKVTAQDPVSKKFLSSSESQAAQDMYSKIQGALADNSDNMAKKEIKDPKSLFGALANLTKLVIKGTNKALMIYGGPGTGKSWTVTNEINNAGMVKNKDWFHIKGKITTGALYETLFMHRKGELIVFDDADSVFGTEDSANLLKAALDSYDERYISWISPKTQNVSKLNDAQREAFNNELDKRLKEDPLDVDYDEETGKEVKKKPIKYPSEFKYEGRIIFISNLPGNKLDSAILTRAFKINMDLTDDQMFMRMEEIIDYLGEPTLTREEKLDTLRILKQRNKLGELKNPSMRTFVAASKIRASGIPNWIELLEYS